MDQNIAARYGSKEMPLPIAQARQTIREDFLSFSEIVMSQVLMPKGHLFRRQPERELNWFGFCEIVSTNYGASLHAGLALPDDLATTQLSIEVRYFRPETHYKDGRKNQRVSRQYSRDFSAHLWVNQGRRYWGLHKSLITGHEFCRGASSAEELAQTVVQRLNDALARRVPTPFDVPEGCPVGPAIAALENSLETA